MAKVDDFFIEDNSVDLISEASYENINNNIDEIEAFSRLTYKSVYIGENGAFPPTRTVQSIHY